MRKPYIFLVALLSLLIGTFGCGDWATSVDKLIDKVEDDLLNDESQIEFLLKGVEGQFGSHFQTMTVNISLLSDESFFDPNIPRATYPSYDVYDQNPDFQLNYADGSWEAMHELRWHAENLLTRINAIESFTDTNLKNKALFWTNFIAGFTRLEMTVWFGLNEEEGGGVLSTPDTPGPFIPASEMYNLSLGYLTEALTYAMDANTTRWVNTVIARLHLAMGQYSAARSAAGSGLQEGDEGYTTVHSELSTNDWYYAQGFGRTQGAMDDRFYQYILDDPMEGYLRENNEFEAIYRTGDGSEKRINMWAIRGSDDTRDYYIQDRYHNKDDSAIFASWQENELILAELDLRDGDAASALTRINAVRAFYNLDPKDTADMDLLIEERDKTLILQGLRLIDQRRFNMWHLPHERQQYQHRGWLYFPIGEDERDRNENIPAKT